MRRVLSGGGFRNLSETCVSDGRIRPDPRQLKVVSLYQDLADRLESYAPPVPHSAASAAAPGFFSRWAGSAETPAGPVQLSAPKCRGLYVSGGTGTGKTMLMDLFFESVGVERKKRVHFHGWMLDVHQRLHAMQKEGQSSLKCDTASNLVRSKSRRVSSAKDDSKRANEDDLVDRVADMMMKDAHFICFDEFQVTFISDAVIMRRLLTKLFERGAVIVATSNRPPTDLYQNGLNRELFTPFIPVLEKFCIVHAMDAGTDYRMLAAAEVDERSVYFSPNNEKTRRMFEAKFYRMAQNDTIADVPLEVQGRTLHVTRVAKKSSIAWFTFKELCDKPLGAADYLKIAHSFHTVYIDSIPLLSLQERDQIRRFITLVDALYDSKVRLICCAAAPPLALFTLTDSEKKISSAMDEVFAWDRLVSRLTEMQSADYLADHAKRLSASQLLSQYKLAELSEDDIADLWSRYDVDNNGSIDAGELEDMLEDLFESAFGHRHVSKEVLQLCLQTMDVDKDGVVSKDEFTEYAKQNGLTAHRFNNTT
jgi:predicted ATPase